MGTTEVPEGVCCCGLLSSATIWAHSREDHRQKKENSKLFLAPFSFVCVQWRAYIRANALAIDQEIRTAGGHDELQAPWAFGLIQSLLECYLPFYRV